MFIPLLFMTGLVGRMFREFALTLTIAVVVSAIVSLTLTPMMCARLLRHESHGGGNRGHALVQRPGRRQRRGLRPQPRMGAAPPDADAAGRPPLTLVATVWLYVVVPKGFLPLQDTGLITAVTEAGTEVSFAEMQRLQKLVADTMRADPDVTGVVSVVGVSPLNADAECRAASSITLKPRGEREAVVSRDHRAPASDAVADIPGMTVYFQPVQDIQIAPAPSRAQYQYTLVGTDAAEVDAVVGQAGRARCGATPTLRDVSSEAQEGGLRALRQRRPREGRPARRLDAGRSTTRSTTRSASGRSRPSTGRRTSTA